MKKEWLLLLFLLSLYLGIRSLHFLDHLNFTQDPASFATSALEIWQDKKIELIGPPVSFRLGARYLFQGSIIYYFLLIFLLAGRFDPAVSSYLFMVFSGVMLIPLYYGAKWLVNKKIVLLTCIIYTLLPFYIEHTRFFWNPNFQLALTPLLVFILGLYHKQKQIIYLFLVGLLSGMLLMFHYQFIVVLFGLLIYFAIFRKEPILRILVLVTGYILGVFPLILFDIRNQFYNLQTILLYLKNFNQVFIGQGSGTAPHYILSLGLFLMLILGVKINRLINYRIIITLSIILLFTDLIIFLPRPDRADKMTIIWKYTDDKRIYEIVKSQPYKNYNITIPIYDNVAVVSKFFLKHDRIIINYEDYYQNEYLYAVNDSADFSKFTAYEISQFLPRKLINKWKINEKYNLYLFERQN